MSWIKIAVAVVAVVGILVIIGTTPNMKIPGLSDLGNSLSGIQGLFSSIPFLSGGSAFDFKLNSSVEPLLGQTLDVKQVSVSVVGFPASTMAVGNSIYQTRGATSLRLTGFDGKIGFSFGVMRIDGEADELGLNSTTITPAEKKLRIAAEIVPTSYSIMLLEKNPFVVSGVYGTLTKSNGAASQKLTNATLEISNFRGEASLSGGYLLSGSATQIKSQSFTWTG